MRLRIGILGTRGIPNRYGGFEQVAEYLSKGLVTLGHAVTVYNTHSHPFQKDQWNGVRIVHCFDPGFLGTAGQFVYDLNCILHARKQGYDLILVLGYTSSSVWGWLYPKHAVIITNMDGLEWKRSKYTEPVKRFLLYAEKLAVSFSDRCIADSIAIQAYLDKKYAVKSHYIAYGAELIDKENPAILEIHGLEPKHYFLLMARMEPENNIETILEGICSPKQPFQILVIGNTDNPYGKKMRRRFHDEPRVQFLGSLFDRVALHTLKNNCLMYFHGHSVGGTNPSLLEAMASRALICAHDNGFNRAILGTDAFYFTTSSDIAYAASLAAAGTSKEMINNNFEKASTHYNWETIIAAYNDFFIQSVTLKK